MGFWRGSNSARKNGVQAGKGALVPLMGLDSMGLQRFSKVGNLIGGIQWRLGSLCLYRGLAKLVRHCIQGWAALLGLFVVKILTLLTKLVK
ncbi:hypothetical protein SLEP1_g32244 [Rubroshorea leprosula]|uniref:Uncharacterized protein n=1 Tax=Rubroshorea leprosula TaxID=152421 RepID=A0AAV5KCR0_9ROSI|nr:hypothetical protein SLEP1_g32244 [Rubroshorea leprosula]